ncbi:MAG: hypothetical protein ACFE9Y_11655, partial [Promethearchaeota archaeon]
NSASEFNENSFEINQKISKFLLYGTTIHDQWFFKGRGCYPICSPNITPFYKLLKKNFLPLDEI